MIEDSFARAFAGHFPDLVGQRIAVALSGGPDSVALVRLLVAANGRLGCGVVAVHVNHRLRGSQSDEDAAFCRELCRRWEIECRVLEIDQPRPARGCSPEAWWRERRYRLLEEGRVGLGAAALATAHTADDQAETVLLKLLRGAGPRGVAGIRRRQGAVIRPLLGFRRDALRRFLGEAGVAWREDATNAATDRPRGWTRHVLLPLLRQGDPRVVEHLAGFAEILAGDDEFFAALLDRDDLRLGLGRPVRVAAVRALAPALLRRWVMGVGASLPLAEPPSRRQVAAAETVIGDGPATAVDLGRHWVMRRRAGLLHLSPPPCPPFSSVPAELPSEIALPGGFVARLGILGDVACHRAELASRVTGNRVSWRSVRPGEAVRGRSVARGLARAGVPPEWRRGWPVLETDGTIIWVPAVGIADGWEGDGSSHVVAELEEPWKRPLRSCDRS
jgi:tRNA(Ile)-lysidine synthase